MKFKQNIGLIVVAASLLAVAYGIRWTGTTAAPPSARTARRAPSDRTVVVDQSSLVTAEQLVRMPTTADERPFAEDAMRIADNEMDLAFAQAVRRTLNLPKATTAEAKEADERLQRTLRALAADQGQVSLLTAALAKANVAGAEALTDRLDLAKAQTALDQDAVDDARQDLRRAGGDPQGRMEELLAEHEAASKSSDSVRVVVTGVADSRGLLRRLRDLQSLYAKEALLRSARAAADSLARVFRVRHDSLEARTAAIARDTAAKRLSHDSSAALLAATQRLARVGKIRATLDERVGNQHALSDAYAGWIGVLAAHERMSINGSLRALALILLIALATLLLSRWAAHALGSESIDRPRAHTLYVVTRVSLQVLAVLLILLVIFGQPDNLGTIIGLAGAGLTVALKDFILAFIGWFVLMGRHGIRLGDFVEINGVTGEVVQLGVFYTVLLETGHWTEAGHPTGRRATFMNGFAVEGHYFNFSTTGRWLWDDLRVVVPSGRDPYPIAEALEKQVSAATAGSAREAETEWQETWRSPHVTAPAAGANIGIKPVAGGVEITVRYITRVTEREALREKLYHTAVEMLGEAAAVAPARAPRTRG